MGTPAPKHFDYLRDHAAELESKLGLVNLSKDVAHWRRFGMEHPDGALVGSRKVVETALKRLVAPLPDSRMRLNEIIDLARNEGVIDKVMALKCHEIRNKGNQGAHVMTVKAIDAKVTLELLDDFLRWCTVKLDLMPAGTRDTVSANDPVFVVRSEEDVTEVTRKASIAASLENNRVGEGKAKRAREELESVEDTSTSDLQRMQELIRKAREIGASAAEHHDERTLAAQRELFCGLEAKVAEMNAQRQAAGTRFDEVSTQVEEILNEHDFIRRLLRGTSRATVDQHDVMAFPRGTNSVTNILQIAGGAGTGKTLCLLAKLISEVDDGPQMSLLTRPKKRALFVCFNKGLATYVRSIMAGYDGQVANIDVESYDAFVNQLVRQRPRSGYERLATFAQDAKYSHATITYSSGDEYSELLRQAQESVARRHPGHERDYYLNPSDEEGFQWLKDELLWIEARFSSDEEARKRYPTASRVGRGRKRVPGEAARRIILEVWEELNRLLTANGLYTIEQATKRLLASDSLPAYDAIAIDEVQDFSLISVRLLVRFKADSGSKVFLAGDENQKIYKRDFTWKELGDDLRGHTITLHKNMRNTSAIRSFADRLLGVDCPHGAASDKVHVVNADESRTVALLGRLASLPTQTTALITGSRKHWEDRLRASGVSVARSAAGDIRFPGLHVVGNYTGKGLEFDNVVVDYVGEASEDAEEEKRLRYVHFTRARKRLYIRYEGTPPRLLSTYYADFLQ